ncbi:MAG: Uma2 family endonuclease, partial [Cyanobacteria bacterium J06621_11]
KEIQVPPVGDKCVNRKPDMVVLAPEHLESARQSITLGLTAPIFIAEVVSPGPQSSDNYLRDYEWKRQQYEDWQIPEYWIIDPHREQVSVLTFVDGAYQKAVFTGESQIISATFPTIEIAVDALLSGQIDD